MIQNRLGFIGTPYRLFLAFICLCQPAGFILAGNAQDSLAVHKYNIINSGLSSDYLKSLMQDREGYIWIATDNGLNRFDGYKTAVYKPDFNRESTFNTVDFTSLAEDRDGNLWLGTDHSGINIYNKRSGRVTVIDRNSSNGMAIKDNNINHIYCDSSGRIWICSQGGLNRFDPSTGTMTAYSDAARPGKHDPFGTVSIACQDRNGKILVGTWGNGMYVYDEGRDDFTQLKIGREITGNDSINRMVRILEDRGGHYWIGSWEGGLVKTLINNYQSINVLQYYNQNPGQRFSISSNIIYDLHEDDDGSIWAGTPFGLNIIRRHWTGEPEVLLVESGERPSDLAQNDVYDILRDKPGIIWLATGGGGLHKIDRHLQRIGAYSIPRQAEFHEMQSIRSFIIDSDSSLLIGVNGLGFGKYILDERKFIQYRELPRFRDLPRQLNAATCFLLDREENLWIGTRYDGLFMIASSDDQTFHFLDNDPVTGDRSRMINALCQDRHGSIWVGTATGLFRLRAEAGADYRLINRCLPDATNPQSINGSYISAIYEDSDSNIWIGTVGGALNRAKIGSETDSLEFRHFTTRREDSGAIRSNVVYAILQDRHNRLWFGTGTAGLALFNPEDERFVHFTKDAGIRGDAILDIIEAEGDLWLTTNNGLVRLSYRGDDDFRTEVFTQEDGLHSNIFIDGACYKSVDGRIFTGDYYGFNVFRPGDLFSNLFIPSLAVTEILVNNEPVNVYEALEKGLILEYNLNGITVECSSLSFSQPFKNNYAFKMEGLDEGWIRTGYEGRVVNYAHIPPGRYTLLMKGSNSSGLWSETPVSLSVRIKPHPARSWWAILIYSVLLLAILVAIYYFLINNIKIKQAYEIERIERKKEENINQFKFRFFTNISHELLTPLSVLSYSIEDLLAKKTYDGYHLGIMERNVRKIMHLISQLLDFRKVESGSMKPLVSPGDIGGFIGQICINLKPLEERKNITVTVTGNVDRTIYFDHDKLDKITCNLLSNAFRFTPENGRILIGYRLDEEEGTDWLRLEITDSGKGIDPDKLDHVFERFYQVKSVTGKSFGAGIGLALAKNLAENHKGTITVENAENLGARFTVCIPVSKEAYSPDEIQPEAINYQSGNFIIDHDAPHADASGEPGGLPVHKRRKTILVVEDNPDFRGLLVRHLSNFHHTLEAENGEEAWRICLDRQPDLVVTDLMMPVMDGLELCKKIRNTLETSHIIVILLTARSDEETRYESYLADADSWIPKPVNMRTLDTRIESLLEQREKLVRRYSNGKEDPEAQAVQPAAGFTELDRKFLDHCRAVIEADMINPELNVVSLGREVGISTSNLYRKITSLTGMSPVEFIRHIRLQSAAAMLVKEGANVSEAANRCGFSDISYFCKTFKKAYGVSPKKYQGSQVSRLNRA